MAYCFIWLSQQAETLQEGIAQANQALVNIRTNENAVA